MRKSKFKENQIVGILGEGEEGLPVAELCRKHGISNATYYQWKSKYSGISASELKRIKELEAKNSKLKRMYEELALGRDYAKLSNRPDSKTVIEQLQGWFDDYNSCHSHSALGYLPPKLFREKQSVT